MTQLWLLTARRHGLFTLIALLVGTLQTVLWPFFTGLQNAPQLWLLFISYFILTRPLQKGIILSYYYSFVFSQMTIHPIGFTWIALLATALTLNFYRERLLGPGGSSGYSYLLVTSAGLMLTWHASVWLIGVLLEDQIPPLHLLDRLFDTILTIPFSVAIFPLVNFLDRTDSRAPATINIVASGGEE